MGLLDAIQDPTFRADVKKNARNLAQSASNTLAENVSMPVDLTAMLLRKAGLPIPENPTMGSDWMRQNGLTAAVQPGPSALAGETLGLLAPMAATKQGAAAAAGLLNRYAENVAAPATLNKQTGAIVWHGSPHKFDKFDFSKIGTGEGAQAYGHGGYVAENPEVAAEYQRRLGNTVIVDGKPLIQNGKISGSTGNKELDGLLDLYGGDMQTAIKDQLSIIRDKRSRLPSVESDLVRKVNQSVLKDEQKLLAEMRGIKNSAVAQNTGYLYKVDLPDEHIAKMLDWDKPLSQQHPDVQAALSTVAKGSMTGEQAYKAAIRESGNPLSSIVQKTGQVFNTPDAASENLRRLGIPGIRYLDGGSRGTGAGTSNFVVFPGNEGLLNILERNGQPVNKLQGLLSP